MNRSIYALVCSWLLTHAGALHQTLQPPNFALTEGSSFTQRSLNFTARVALGAAAEVESLMEAPESAESENVLDATAPSVGGTAAALLSISTASTGSEMLPLVFCLVAVPLALCLVCSYALAGEGEGSPKHVVDTSTTVSSPPAKPAPSWGTGLVSMPLKSALSKLRTEDTMATSAASQVGSRGRQDSLSTANSPGFPCAATFADCGGYLNKAMIAPGPQGVTLALSGVADLLPTPQEVQLDVRQLGTESLATMGGGRTTVLRLLISETNFREAGVLMETVLSLPICMLDTSQAMDPTVARDSPTRTVRILQDMSGTGGAFAMVRKASRGIYVAYRERAGREEVLLKVQLDEVARSYANVHLNEGQLVATMETRPGADRVPQKLIHMTPGADAAFVLCLIVAAVKLS